MTFLKVEFWSRSDEYDEEGNQFFAILEKTMSKPIYNTKNCRIR